MERLRLIIWHEYKTIVGKKSFIVMTLLIPFLIVLVGAIPVLFAYLNDAGDTHVERYAVLDESGGYGSALKNSDNYEFVLISSPAGGSNARELYSKTTSLTGVVVIPRDVAESHDVSIYSEETLSNASVSHIEKMLSDTLTAAKISGYNIAGLDKILEESNVEVSGNSVVWDSEGNEQRSSAGAAMIIGMVLAMVTYMFVLSYGAMIMNSVVEEKTNRIVEVIVSSCKPIELMLGKIIGVGLVGLTQFALWSILIGAITVTITIIGGGAALASGVTPDSLPSGAQAADPTAMAELAQIIGGIDFAKILFNFVLYFIGGYLLYASLFAGFGSAVDQASDASQFTLPVILLMVVALYAGIACIENPNGPMAVWCSIIPFTSPVVMMVRLPYDVPLWQQALSIVLLFATALAATWFAARVYRTGILLYGKKRSFGDLFRWTVGRF